MRNTIGILTGILALQLLLTVGLYSNRQSMEAFSANEQLLSFSKPDVDRVVFSQADGKVEIAKKESGWVLPAEDDFPASEEKIDGVLAALLQAKRSWPVGKTKIALKQFKLTEENHERKVDFFSGEKKLETLYLGTSPEFKRIHARPSGDESSYVIDFAAHELGGKTIDWYDKTLLHVDLLEVERLELPGYTLEKQDNSLVISGLGDGQETNRTAVNQLTSAIAAMPYNLKLGTEEQPDYNLAQPAFEYTVKLSSGKEISLKFGHTEGEEYYVVKSSLYPYYFTTSTYSLESIKDKKVEDLIVEKPASKNTPESAEDAE